MVNVSVLEVVLFFTNTLLPTSKRSSAKEVVGLILSAPFKACV